MEQNRAHCHKQSLPASWTASAGGARAGQSSLSTAERERTQGKENLDPVGYKYALTVSVQSPQHK